MRAKYKFKSNNVVELQANFYLTYNLWDDALLKDAERQNPANAGFRAGAEAHRHPALWHSQGAHRHHDGALFSTNSHHPAHMRGMHL